MLAADENGNKKMAVEKKLFLETFFELVRHFVFKLFLLVSSVNLFEV
jgi:hypothetical protein